MKPLPLISEFLWLPLITVAPNQRGFLVQPGSSALPVRIQPGRFWHWPYLTTVRLVSLDKHLYPINKQIIVDKRILGDEPIIAATKDMRLISLEGQLKIQTRPDAPDTALAKLNKHSINRLIRPLIRSGIRQAVAEFNYDQLSDINGLTQQADALVKEYLAEHGLQISNLELHPVKPFNLFGLAKNLAIPGGQAQPGINGK